ncbi:DUF3592 domain-containing protein [Nocardia sp. NPDC002869]|uniref:DUF3592 domain-containing protein n=1 Tax=Nocardia sp. NPDC002869 TaxID=3161032 RepID=UPI00398D68DD
MPNSAGPEPPETTAVPRNDHALGFAPWSGIWILCPYAGHKHNALFLANSQIATGTAVEFGHELTDNTKGSRPAGTSTVIEFTTADGETVRFDGGPAASSLYTDLGDRIPGRYDPVDPDHALVDEAFLFVRLPYLPLIFAAFGAATLGTVAWVMLRYRIRQPAIR